MDPLIYSIKFKVKGHDVNPNKSITLPALLRKMQEASLQHARQLNASVWDMTEDKLTWVLIRKELKIIEHLRMDQTYTVLTYPSGFDKFFAYRDYLIFDSDKKLVVGASSCWTLIQTDERRLMKIPQKIMEIGVPKDTRFLPRPTKTIAFPDKLTQVDQRKVRPYDLDWNDHVSNIVLLRFMVESLKSQGIQDDQVEKIWVQYKNELILNEIVNVEESRNQDECFSVLKAVDSKKEIALSKITLKQDAGSKSGD